MTCMAEKKNNRHKQKPFQLRLHDQLREALDELARRNASDVSDEIRIAIRKHLAEAGLWPSVRKEA
jgi:predicted transcriptional regulator